MEYTSDQLNYTTMEVSTGSLELLSPPGGGAVVKPGVGPLKCKWMAVLSANFLFLGLGLGCQWAVLEQILFRLKNDTHGGVERATTVRG